MYIRPDSKVVPQYERRWNRLVELTDQTPPQRPSPPGDDKWVCQAYPFLLGFKQANGDEELQKSVAYRYPHLYDALLLRLQAEPACRAAVEGMLLANVSIKHIANELSVHEDVIYWYQRLWYDLGDKPLSRLQITTQLIPSIHSANPDADNIDAFFKLLGGCHNPNIALDTIELRALEDSEAAAHHKTFQSLLLYKATRALYAMPVNSFTSQAILELYANMDRWQKEASLLSQSQGGTVNEMTTKALSGASAAWRTMQQAKTASEIPMDLHSPRKGRTLETTLVGPKQLEAGGGNATS